MADLINNVTEVCKKWESRAASNRGRFNSSISSRSNVKRSIQNESNTYFINSRSRGIRNFKRPHYSIPKDDGLAEFKMAPSVVSLQKARPFVGIPCVRCVPHSRAGIEDSTLYLLGVHNILHIPYLTLHTYNICCFWNLFKVQTPLISHDASADLLKSKRIQETFKEIITRNGDDVTDDAVINELNQKGKEIINHLKTSVSSFCLEIACFCLHYILKRIFSGIFVHKGQLEILKIQTQESIPFVFLPLYRSDFDHIIVPYILHRNSISIPYTVVTDEKCIPFLSSIFKCLGAIFVKSNLLLEKPEDVLYNTLVKNYVVKCLEEGHSISFFLESKQSISGKPGMPNTNLLSAILHAVSEGSLEDAYIVPVSTTYETIGENFIADHLGGHSNSKSEAGVFSKLYSFWKFLHLKYGNVRVNINQPFSVKEFLKNSKQPVSKFNMVSHSSSSDLSSKGIEICISDINSSIKDLASHSMYDAITCTSLMCTHLLAFLFVTQYRKGGTQQQLQRSMDWLRSEILRKKSDIGFSGESLPVIKRAIELLGKDLISTETVEMEWTSSDLENNNVKVKIYTPVVKLPYVLELQYYANAVVPLFLRESILVNALYALVDVDICHFHHCDSRFYVSREELVQTSIKLSEFLTFEFITVPPCEDIVLSFNDVIDELIDKECLSTTGAGDSYLKSKRRSRALSFDISDDEQCFDEPEEQQLKIDLREESISHLEFLRSILSPYIESYWLASCSLLRLIDEVKEESVFIQEMQLTAQDKLYKGLLAYEESFSANTLKNCLKMFYAKKIIECDYECSLKTIYLRDSFNSFESINELIADIEDFRK